MNEAGAICKFRIKNIDLTRKSLFVRVVVMPDRKLIRELFGNTAYAGFLSGDQNKEIGTIYLSPSPKIKMFTFHESVHAAFETARSKRWKPDGCLYEEFIARTAEYIAEKILKRIS